jgi:hypothetical protein
VFVRTGYHTQVPEISGKLNRKKSAFTIYSVHEIFLDTKIQTLFYLGRWKARALPWSPPVFPLTLLTPLSSPVHQQPYVRAGFCTPHYYNADYGSRLRVSHRKFRRGRYQTNKLRLQRRNPHVLTFERQCRPGDTYNSLTMSAQNRSKSGHYGDVLCSANR